jgi:hypothetical protein
VKDGKRLLYWDACVFIAHLKKETVWGLEVSAGIDQARDEIDQGRWLLLTSSLTRSEIFQGILTPEQKKIFTSLFGRRNIIQQDVTPKIADHACVIREYYDNQQPRVKIDTPDAIHLATALGYGVDEVWTLDGAGSVRTRPSQLLRLGRNGQIAGKKLIVKKPAVFTSPMAEALPVKKPVKPEPYEPLFNGL